MGYRPFIFAGLLLLATLFALVRGGGPERWAAAAYLSAYTATVWLTVDKHSAFHRIEWGVFATDLALMVVLMILALQSNRMWTLWAASFQLVGVSAHLAKLMIPEILAGAYAATLMIWSYAVIPVLLLATLRHRRRIAAYGTDPAWSPNDRIHPA